MDSFDSQIKEQTGDFLHCTDLEIIQANLGFICNQRCSHCHLDASPDRKEMMDLSTMESIVSIAFDLNCRMVDITGGAPELNPHFRKFVSALRDRGLSVQVRTNLTVFTEPGMDDLPEFFDEYGVMLVASMPCYLEENVTAQRGEGVYVRCIEAIRRLNALGYGVSDSKQHNLVYNPGGAFLPPEQTNLEKDYRRELDSRFGIRFSRLLTITNMPLGRFGAILAQQGKYEEYMQLLKNSFNPGTIEGLMCRRQISVAWNGFMYDCDFNMAMQMRVNHGAPEHIGRFDADSMRSRRIVTSDHCFGCTAGAGSSCAGAIV